MSSDEYMMKLREEMRDYLDAIRESFSTKEDYIRCCVMALEVMEADITPEQELDLMEENAEYYGIELDDTDDTEFFDFSEMFDEPNDSDSDDTEAFDFDEMFASIYTLTESLRAAE